MSTFWPGEDRHSVLVCQGIRASGANRTKRFWDFVSSLLTTVGCPISDVADDSGRYKSYMRVKRKLDAILSTTRMFGVRSLLPAMDESKFEYLAMADINLNQNNLKVLFDIKAGLMDVRSSQFKEVAKGFIEIFGPRYCYGFSRPFRYRPDLYAVGLGNGNNPPNQRENGWTYYGPLNDNYLKGGWLREVYALNYLTDAHLLAPVGNVALKEWILQSPNRGTLAPVTNEMMLWEVPDERLTELSDQLYAAGRVFDVERDVLSKRPPPTTPMSLEEATGQVLEAFGFTEQDADILDGAGKPISEEARKEIFKKKPKK